MWAGLEKALGVHGENMYATPQHVLSVRECSSISLHSAAQGLRCLMIFCLIDQNKIDAAMTQRWYANCLMTSQSMPTLSSQHLAPSWLERAVIEVGRGGNLREGWYSIVPCYVLRKPVFQPKQMETQSWRSNTLDIGAMFHLFQLPFSKTKITDFGKISSQFHFFLSF